MRILYLCGDHGIPAFGRKGASTHLREMIAALRAEGHEVCLAAADTSGDRRPEEDFRVERLPAPTSRLLGIDGRYLLGNALATGVLRRLAAEFRPDALYERSSLYFSAGEALARARSLPRILEVNALLSEEQAKRLHFPAFAHRRELGTIRRAPAVAAISDTMIRQLSELGCDPARARPFPMAVDPARFAPTPLGAERRAALGWGPEVLVLGYVGSMNSYHRPAWFMDFAEKVLRTEDRRFRFLVVGGSSSKVERHRSRLARAEAEGLAHFTGTVPQARMAEWLCAMDAVVVPGAAPQSTPTKIFEAAACGRPMILPATDPIGSLVGKDSPFLFRAEDFRAFEEKLLRFAAEPGPFLAEAERFRAHVLANHTWQHHARSITAWFAELRGATP